MKLQLMLRCLRLETAVFVKLNSARVGPISDIKYCSFKPVCDFVANVHIGVEENN